MAVLLTAAFPTGAVQAAQAPTPATSGAVGGTASTFGPTPATAPAPAAGGTAGVAAWSSGPAPGTTPAPVTSGTVAAPAPGPAPDGATGTAAPAADPAAQPATDEARLPWIKRYRPVRKSWELGIYGGAFFPSTRHEFYKPDLSVPDFGHQPLARAGADFGARVGYYPLSFLGVELEGGLIPIRVADGTRATVYTIRPVVVAQLPYRIAPFLRAGFGGVGITSDALGRDIDPSINIGGGVKFYINRLLLLRLDIVDNVTTARGIGNARSNNLEVLLGLSVRLGKKAKAAEPAGLRDTDRDGLYDPGQVGVAPIDEDVCPLQPGPRENRGCPLRDTDSDGLYDPGQGGVAPIDEDACWQAPGPRDTRGCPLIDSDGDTLYDPGQPVAAADTDQCPREPGPRELRGCPDRDGDKIVDQIDKCPDAPETINQIQDTDGCPDAIPSEVQKMTGVIKGIFFDVDKDTIKPRSRVVLDRAVRVLQQFPETRWRIEGHTDSDGSREHNLDLSQRRAESVRRYLIDRGIDGSRLVPKGFGPDQPIDTNSTTAGKAMNRRIEFELID